MGWDSGSRAKLNRLRRSGVIAVRYVAEGCNVELEVLENCIGKGSYAYEPYAATDTKVAKNAAEVFADFPLGAGHLGAHVKGGKVLRTDYMMVGTDALPPSANVKPSDLEGRDCDRATHVVRTVYLGGFAMAAGTETELSGGASVFGVGAGAATRSSAERVASEGVLPACEQAQRDGHQNQQCSVPLRIALLPLEGRAPKPAPLAAPTAATAANSPRATPTTSPTSGGASSPVDSSIFQVRGETVVDLQNKLVWQRVAAGPMNHSDAEDYCSGLRLASAASVEPPSQLFAQKAASSGWRLPRERDLRGISGARGRSGGFEIVAGREFWTDNYASAATSSNDVFLPAATPMRPSPGGLLAQEAPRFWYVVDLSSSSGRAVSTDAKHYVRCVKDR